MNVKSFSVAFLCLALVQGTVAAPEPKNVPDLLTTSAGEKITTVDQW